MSETAVNLDTHSITASQFHEIVLFPEKHLMKHSSFIVGVEKSHWEKIGAPEKLDTDTLTYRDNMNKQEKYHFTKILEDKNKPFVSHIARYSEQETKASPQLLYNAYAPENAEQTENAYQNGFNALDALEESLKETMRESATNGKPYTHVIVGAMGWNTNQEKALKYFDKILDEAKESAIKKGHNDFKPLFVGLTWPSVWGRKTPLGIFQKLQHVFSYPDKTDDADRIGYTIANPLINGTISGAVSDLEKEGYPVEIKTVLLGHSLGARLLASAAYGRDMLNNARGKVTDLFIPLQGAFSIRRYLKGEGIEGAPYRNHSDGVKTTVATYSSYDNATPLAELFTGAVHMGSENTQDYISCPIDDKTCQHKTDVFIDLNVQDFSEWQPKEENNKIIHVNTSMIMPDGHNHIDSPEVADFMIDAVYKFAPEQFKLIADNTYFADAAPA